MRTDFDRVSPDAMPPALLLTAEIVTMKRPRTYFSRGFHKHDDGNIQTSCVAILERDRDTREVVTIHDRPFYTGIEAAQTAIWLNERTAGYPVPARLEPLLGGH
jgi:hypothetical protein